MTASATHPATEKGVALSPPIAPGNLIAAHRHSCYHDVGIRKV